MSGFAAGIFSLLALLVVGSIIATFVKNPQGTGTLISDTGTFFTNALVASQGNATQVSSYPG